MTTGPGTGRVSTSEIVRGLLSRGGGERVPTFGVTEDKGPGGIVLPLFRCEIPVCDEFPTSDDAFAAMLVYHKSFRAYAVPDSLATDLARSVKR